MKLLKIISQAILILLAFNSTMNAQFDSIFIQSSPDFEINGNGDQLQWSNSNWVPIAQRDHLGKAKETKAKILYSDNGIYFLFHCQDEKITSTIKKDFGNLYEEDVVEVFFWTDEDYPFYFEYELSPFNFELPIFVPNVKGDFMGWRPWKYEGERRIKHMTSKHMENDNLVFWTAEFFIPFTLLKPMANVPPNTGMVWRANMYRLDYDDEPTRWTWQPIRTNFHDYEMYGYFVFK